MKVAEYIECRDSVNRKVELHINFNDERGCFVIDERVADSREILREISFEWTDAELIEVFLRKERLDADAVDEEWDV